MLVLLAATHWSLDPVKDDGNVTLFFSLKTKQYKINQYKTKRIKNKNSEMTHHINPRNVSEYRVTAKCATEAIGDAHVFKLKGCATSENIYIRPINYMFCYMLQQFLLDRCEEEVGNDLDLSFD